MKSRLSVYAVAISAVSMLAGCGGGGSSGYPPLPTPAPTPPPPSTAEGTWQGETQTTHRALAGVVTDTKQYWLSYSAAGDAATPAGFYSGTGNFSSGSFPSSDLREFNFEGNGALKGSMTATYTITPTYTTANTFAGTFVAPAGQTYDLAIDANAVDMHYSGTAIPIDLHYTGVWDSTAHTANMSGTLEALGDLMTITNQPLTMDSATGVGALLALPTGGCADTGGFCGPVGSIFQGDMFNDISGSAPPFTGQSFALPSTGSSVFHWGIWLAGANGGAGEVFPVEATLTFSGSMGPITGEDFTTNYNPIYETAPALATIAGSYTAGYTGIDTTMNADASITVASDGSITGTEATSFCNYTATIAPHAAGNVYDVTNITFSDNGGNCVYTGKTFTGVATYDAGKLTLTATTAARDYGFMVVATH